MNEISQAIAARIFEIQQELEQISKEQLPSVDGALRITHSRGKPRYYQMTKTGQRYLRKDETELAATLAHQSYLADVKTILCKERDLLTEFQKNYVSEKVIRLFSKMSPERQALIHPIELTESLYAEQWKCKMQQRYSFGAPSYETNLSYVTNQGETVRSKSELILANLFAKYDIPYFYELPLKLGNRIIFPDFTLLNKRMRKTFYWEHFGMLGNSDYQNAAMKKLADYEANHLYENHSLLISRENETSGFSLAAAEQKLKNFLL